jgi:hypothetical protein
VPRTGAGRADQHEAWQSPPNELRRRRPRVTTFLIRGVDPLEDAVAHRRDLIPLARELVARRDAHPTRVAS